MRLWHYKLLGVVPNSQLVSQWRELNCIFVKNNRHILINYVYDNSPRELYNYTILVLREMYNRGFEVTSITNMLDYFNKQEGMEHITIDKVKNDFDKLEIYTCYSTVHNRDYLKQCFYNLQEKYQRGQKDFSRDRYRELVEVYLKCKKEN